MEEQRRRGRPKLNDDIAKNRYIRVRVTSKEANMIESHCKRNDLSVSDMLRSSVYKALHEVK